MMKNLIKTKIIATIGPSTASFSAICKLIKIGVNIFRLNFSHGDHAFFGKVIKNIKRAREKLNKSVAIMQDLQGPKIRIGKLTREFSVKRGGTIIIKNSKKNQGENFIYIDIKNIHKYIKKGQKVLINDGIVELKVKDIRNEDIICSVVSGGEIKSRKGVNLPDVKLPIPALTEKDKKDLKFGLINGVDAICLSFVRDANDLILLDKYLKGGIKPIVIAKIEKPEALKQINKILNLCDGIMVARGDLAVEAGYSIIPQAQKNLIAMANKKGKIVIVATQMLESMIDHPFPQRAEITDIYNAVIDGADVLMLSAETSIGKYPFKTVQVMNKIIKKAERNKKNYCDSIKVIESEKKIKNIISYCAFICACKLKNSIIAVKTKNIEDVSFVSDYRPQNCVMAVTDNKNLYNKLSFINSIYPFLGDKENFLTRIKNIFSNKETVVYVDFHEKDRESPNLILYNLKNG